MGSRMLVKWRTTILVLYLVCCCLNISICEITLKVSLKSLDWQNGKMAKWSKCLDWQNGKMAKWANCFKQKSMGQILNQKRCYDLKCKRKIQRYNLKCNRKIQKYNLKCKRKIQKYNLKCKREIQKYIWKYNRKIQKYIWNADEKYKN